MKLDIDEEIRCYLGQITSIQDYSGSYAINAERGRYFLSRRSPRSDPSAIHALSKEFGVAEVEKVGERYILQPFVDFLHLRLSLQQLARLLREVHSCTSGGDVLVHGDFSRHNTTHFRGYLRCFDYEFTHWGNSYLDIGRVILRECPTLQDAHSFFGEYQGGLPDINIIRDGFISFCDWHYLMRVEKGLSSANVPLERKRRLLQAKSNVEEVFHALTEPVRL